MQIPWILRSWFWTLGTTLLFTFGSVAQASPNADSSVKPNLPVMQVRSQQVLPAQTLLQELAQADVVYLGEIHDRPEDHQAQLEIIQALHQLRPNLAIAMEMFQRPYQSILDRYLAGDLTETEFLERSQYAKRWGFPWKFYAPIVQFAKTNRLPVIALNAPTEVTRKVARKGLDSLTWAERRFIPPLSAISLEPETYRQRIRTIYDEIHQGKSNSLGFERFFQAQVLWDETMAERIAQIRQQQPATLVVVLVGQGHLLYGEGIPNRVARRLQQKSQNSTTQSKQLTQVSVLLNPANEIKAQLNPPIADYFWFSL
jgi:uncharacterized iron-regulated protein